MSDETQDPTDPRDAAAQDPHDDSPATDTDDSALGDKGKQAIQREREARKAAEKARADLEKRLKAIEDERKQAEDAKAKEQGEWEKVATERERELEKLRAQIAERDLNDLKRTVAAEEGLPAELALRLAGDDEDALRTDAKALARHLKAREVDTDAGERTKPGQKKPDKSAYADPARWGLARGR
jgi:hypothetical protein